MHNARGMLLLALMFAALSSAQSSALDALRSAADGWYRWHIESVVDGEEEIIYVRVQSGSAQEIEISGRGCDHYRYRNDHRHDTATDLGVLGVDESISWLSQFIGNGSKLESEALVAISRHAGPRALQTLIDIVESDADAKLRQEAIFWLAMSESREAFDYLDRLLVAE